MLSADDRLAIIDTLARLVHAADARDAAAMTALLAPGGTLGEMGTLLAASARRLSLNHIIEADNGDASVRWTLVLLEREGLPGILASAAVRTDLQRSGGRWLILRQSAAVDPSARAADAARQGP